jgi:rhamnose utilization protein RhaD (predicted bifunctional aldolase and dehydrogenase)/NAD(P)-dependent dehydrogenase (short-subunit alcohol dehydrogenase family)
VDQHWDDIVADGLQDDLDRLVYAANLIGNDPDLALAGGGGVSLRTRGTDFAGRSTELLWVKAAGLPLRGLTRTGLSPLRLSDLARLPERFPAADDDLCAFFSSCRLGPGHPLPSFETALYSALPFPCVLHTHDVATLALTDNTRKDALVREAWGDAVAYTGYVRPGHPLTKVLYGLGDLSRFRALVLGKHGLVVWGNTPREAYASLQDLLARAREVLRKARGTKNPFAKQRHAPGEPARRHAAVRHLLPVLRALLSHPKPVVLHYDDSEEARLFADSETAKQIHRRGMAAPEHILRCGRLPCYVDATLASLPHEEAAHLLQQAVAQFAADARSTIAKHARNGSGGELVFTFPRIIILPGLGLVAAGPDLRSAEIAAQCYRQAVRVIEIAESVDQFRFLEEASSFEFEYGAPELARLRAPEAELAHRIAVVTGAARGIGRAVAVRLAREGAHVVLADVDAAGVEDAAGEAARAAGDPLRARAVAVDAADAAQVRRLFDGVIREFGGVDILFCNAGMVRSSPVEAYSEEDWDRHFDVNVKGCWLAVREAVPAMKAQRSGSIIVNASKAAFAPAAENAAYASSKAAAAALARNLALELAPHGIRVNAVNADFIDTPMMRQMVEDRATRRGVSAEQQLEEYRRRNLLGVGPIPPDAVAEAVLWLASARSAYTTGGVLTVDGGLRDAMPR